MIEDSAEGPVAAENGADVLGVEGGAPEDVASAPPAIGSEERPTGGKPPPLPNGGTLDVPSGRNFDAAADDSTDTGRTVELDLEDTLNSNASMKEFSFGTTAPAKLPPALDLDDQSRRPISPTKLGPVAMGDLSESGTSTTTASPKTEAPPLHPGDGTAQPPRLDERVLSPKGCDDMSTHSPAGSEDNMFTFGTTTPIALPDPALLRQMASAHDAHTPRLGAVAEDAHAVTPRQRGVPPSPAPQRLPSPCTVPEHRVTPRWEPADHNNVPLPPVREKSPPAPCAPPDQAVALRSLSRTGLPAHSRSGLEAACFTPPLAPVVQVAQMPQMPMQYYPHHQVAQTWHEQALLAHAAASAYQDPAQSMPPNCVQHMVPEALHGELQKQQWEVAQLMNGQDAELGMQVQMPGHEDFLGCEHQYAQSLEEQHMTDSMNCNGEAEGYFNGEEGEDEPEETLKVTSEPGRGKRLAAACCIVILAALPVVLVVLFVLPSDNDIMP